MVKYFKVGNTQDLMWGKVDEIMLEKNLQFIVIFFLSAIQYHAWMSEEYVTQADIQFSKLLHRSFIS
jgi:hypothetical protein